MTKILKVDIDLKKYIFYYYFGTKEKMKLFFQTKEAILNIYGLKSERMVLEESNKGFHLIIELDKDVDNDTMIELQFLLGDDVNRVFYNFMRKQYNDDEITTYFNILFTKKYKKKDIMKLRKKIEKRKK
jgi:hypothetical protein